MIVSARGFRNHSLCKAVLRTRWANVYDVEQLWPANIRKSYTIPKLKGRSYELLDMLEALMKVSTNRSKAQSQHCLCWDIGFWCFYAWAGQGQA